MPRAGLDADKIIEVAFEITDRSGIDAVTLKGIGDRLNVTSPSLYNHVGNLANIKSKVSYLALKQLKETMLRAALGKSGTDLIRGIGIAYITFAHEHPHLYDTVQWFNVWDDVAGANIFSDLMRLAWKAGLDMGLDETESNHLIRFVRSLAHGLPA